MRKFTLFTLFAVTLAGGTAEAGDFVVSTGNESHEYFICNAGPDAGGQLCVVSSDGSGLDHTTSYTEGSKFKIEAGEVEGQYYIYCVSNNKYVTYSDLKADRAKIVFTENKSEAQQWRIVEESEGRETYDILPLTDVTAGADGHGVLGWNWFGGIKKPNKLGFYGNTDANSSWTFYKGQPHTLTYNLQYDGTTFQTETYNVETGDPYPAVPVFPQLYVDYESGKPDGTISSTTDETININYTESSDNPVRSTSIVDGAFAENTEWYTFNLPANSSGSWTAMLNSNGDTYSSSTFNDMYNGRDWFCFVGDPVNGYAIYNYGYGIEKPLRIGSDCPTIKAEGTEGKWMVYRSGDNITIGAKNVNGKFWNQLGGAGAANFGFWNGGSPIKLMTSVETAKNYVSKGLLTKVEEKIGGYTQGVVENLMQVAEANGVSETLRNAVISAAETPQANKYYRIYNVSLTNGENHDGLLGTQEITEGEEVKLKAYCSNETKAEAGKIWQIIPVEGGYQFYNVNAKKYLSSTATGSASKTDMSDTPATYSITYMGEGKNKFQNGNYPTEVENNYLNGWEAGDKSRWFIVEATDFEVSLTQVGNASYATAYLPFAVSATGTTKLYTAQQNESNADVINAIETAQIPAEQGFIIEGTEGTATLSIIDNAAEVTGNVLSGTLQNKDGIEKGDYYILGNGDNGLGFYHPNLTTLVANKAFIAPTTAQAASLRLNFGGNVTGINGATIDGAGQNQPIYDLSGRRVEKATKGIYIQGGKKILVK